MAEAPTIEDSLREPPDDTFVTECEQMTDYGHQSVVHPVIYLSLLLSIVFVGVPLSIAYTYPWPFRESPT